MSADDLRAAFARHEELVPPTEPLRQRIAQAVIRRRRRRAGLRVSVAAALVAAVAIAPTTWRQLTPQPSDTLAQLSGPTPAAGPLDLLVLGIDSRATAPENLSRADTILLVHVPASRDRAYVISIERDTVLDIPGIGLEKVNAAYARGSQSGGRAGGFGLTSQTLTRATGVTFDAGAIIDFAGLADLTDAVGGVKMCVDRAVTSVHTGRVFAVGCRQFTGAEALDYVRQRYGLADAAFDRDRHAIDYLQSLLAAARGRDLLSDPLAVDRLITNLHDTLTVDPGQYGLAGLFNALGGVKQLIGIESPWDGYVDLPGPTTAVRFDVAAAGELYAALRADTLDRWVTAHPDAVS